MDHLSHFDPLHVIYLREYHVSTIWSDQGVSILLDGIFVCI